MLDADSIGTVVVFMKGYGKYCPYTTTLVRAAYIVAHAAATVFHSSHVVNPAVPLQF